MSDKKMGERRGSAREEKNKGKVAKRHPNGKTIRGDKNRCAKRGNVLNVGGNIGYSV